jgi:hypothetical protein
MMIHNAWLGYYWSGTDPFDEPLHRLHLFASSSDVPRFEYYYEFRSNHGYDLEFQEGTITSFVDDKLAINVDCRFESSWEDFFKEHRLEKYITSTTGIINIKSIERDKPILVYKGICMFFKCIDSFEDTYLFTGARAEMARLKQEG